MAGVRDKEAEQTLMIKDSFDSNFDNKNKITHESTITHAQSPCTTV